MQGGLALAALVSVLCTNRPRTSHLHVAREQQQEIRDHNIPM